MRFRGETQPAVVKVPHRSTGRCWRKSAARRDRRAAAMAAAWLQPQTVVERIKIELTFAPGAALRRFRACSFTPENAPRAVR